MAPPAGPAEAADDPLMKASTRCGSVAGIPLYVHHTFALWLGFAVLLSPEWSAPAVIYRMLVYGPVLFGTVLVHEIGHCKACERAGGTAKVNDPRPKQRHTHTRPRAEDTNAVSIPKRLTRPACANADHPPLAARGSRHHTP